MLQHHLRKWDKNEVIKNCSGETVRCKFVDARRQFFSLDNPENNMFCVADINKRPKVELTHRNVIAMTDLARMWRDTFMDAAV